MFSLIRSSLLGALLVSTLNAQADLRMPAIFSDHMVLQVELENPVWGWAKPGTKVSVSIGGNTVEAEADSDGRWLAKLPAMPLADEPLTMVVTDGTEEIAISDVLIGEVWICSGQSNMGWPLKRIKDGDLEIATANYPEIRLLSVPQTGTQELQVDFEQSWTRCTPQTVAEFSAVGYLFGRQLYQTLGVPIGLIDNAWGGSAAEAWISREVLEQDGRFEDYLTSWEKKEAEFDWDRELREWEVKVAAANEAGKQIPRRPRNILVGQHRPGNLWAGVLNPTIGYGIRGVIWYQGESNAGRAYLYDELFALLIEEWRQAWGQGDFPFYWVQLADFRPEKAQPEESAWAELREAQSKTLALPNTGQALAYDVGEGRDVHPRDKQSVAKRLARIALARDYGEDIVYLSPSFESMEISDGKVFVHFKDVGEQLYAFDVKEVIGFSLAGEDRVWHPAIGELQGEKTVIVTSESVPQPVAVRYAWADNPVANLMNTDDLPAIPFRTDDWPLSTEPKED